jgi:hypothetical protein
MKIHLAADDHCRPLAFVVTAGHTGDAPAFPDVMARLRVPQSSDTVTQRDGLVTTRHHFVLPNSPLWDL